MMHRLYEMDDVAIVGMGCVFPDAPDVNAFWKNIVQGKCSIRELPESRWESELYLGNEPDKAYSRRAAYVEEERIEAIAAKLGLERHRYSRLQLMALEAARQALDGFEPQFLDRQRSFISLGCMGQDELGSCHYFGRLRQPLLEAMDALGAGKARGREIVERTIEEVTGRVRCSPSTVVLTSSVTDAMGRTFGLKGEHCLIDAACGSSLAAIDAAVRRLRGHDCDFALTGGIESQLGPENFILFCSLKLHSKTVTLPLDDRTDGLNQGEGAGVFALMRLGDAVREGVHIRAVIRASAASSNGRGASLFSPTVSGQQRVLEKAYAGLDPSQLDFVEFHATGTRVGDATEIEAMDAFLGDLGRKIPVGSVKALMGHTKGAAGAAGLLKTVLIIENRTVSPSPYFERFVDGKEPKSLYVNREAVVIPTRDSPLLCGVSAAGFGGINFHLVVEEFKAPFAVAARAPRGPDSVVTVSACRLPCDGIRDVFEEYGFRIPPKNLAQIDDLQLVALVAVQEALDRAQIDADTLPKERVSVLSASILGVEAYKKLGLRVRHWEFFRHATPMDEAVMRVILRHRENYPPIEEDLGPGSLNNVIAGRVMNVFDFQGKSLNVDVDLSSFPVALKLAKLELSEGQSDWVIVLGVEEEIFSGGDDFRSLAVHALVLTRESEALRLHRSPLFSVGEVHGQ